MSPLVWPATALVTGFALPFALGAARAYVPRRRIGRAGEAILEAMLDLSLLAMESPTDRGVSAGRIFEVLHTRYQREHRGFGNALALLRGPLRDLGYVEVAGTEPDGRSLKPWAAASYRLTPSGADRARAAHLARVQAASRP